ncbi:MAG: oxygen-independent coproporphyrinogen III oxidase [Pseudomonadota bacterium]|nr:oxygen-independent coproporphyrinogen III oxidase [Pseudomonadota bacterium]
MDRQVIFDPELIRRYDTSGPRYTSYPTAVQFSDRFGPADHADFARLAVQGNPALSLYVHIPFCATVCFYCGCNKIVTRDRERAAPYLERLHKEMRLQGELVTGAQVEQLHLGGGTPTFLNDAQMRALMQGLANAFDFAPAPSRDFSIEIDPREASPDTIGVLGELGFNRLSLGVQDFDPSVQQAVNRIQPVAVTEAALAAARANGFGSINVDLMYGLPRQSKASFTDTLDCLIALAPDRVSLFNYAHMPERFKQQRGINALEIPSPSVKLAILQTAIERLTAAGYRYIGMDHFAKSDDSLTQAQDSGQLTRNFQGYSTHGHCNLLGLGVSAISAMGKSYSQNLRTELEYTAALDGGRLPVFQGIALGFDDCLRRALINELMCHFRLDCAAFSTKFGVDFEQYFAAELSVLAAMAADGLLHFDGQVLHVNAAGKLLIRNICMVFDAYLQRESEAAQRYSRTI